MKNDASFLQARICVPIWFMKYTTNEPFIGASRPCSTPHSAPVAWLGAEPPLEPPAAVAPDREATIAQVFADPDLLAEILARAASEKAPATRHDGWTGERIATFLETLADTGLVTEASRAAGMSRDAAYSLRSRDPVIAAAWRAAQAKARPHLADGLLERSITGTVEHYYRDGVLVGERRHFESWLGLAVLKRLDKQAEEDRADATLAARMAGEWQATLDALRTGGMCAVPALLEPKTDKADTPPPPPDYEDDLDLSARCWQNEDDVWMTDFPPPPDFDGYEKGKWGDYGYERGCTDDEIELLEAQAEADRVEDEALRDAWFQLLKDEAEQMGHPAIVDGHERPPSEMLQSGDESVLTSAEDGSPVE
jgi:hypothetical protein